MKQFILSLFLLMCMMTGYAQKTKHPSLLYTPELIQRAKQRIVTEPKYAEAWKQLKKVADEKLQGKDIRSLEYLSLAYLMTGEKEYSDKIKEILLNVIEAETWGSSEMLARIPVWTADLGLAHKAYLSAIAYNTIYNDLSISDKKK